jgi:hypothetical protein
VWFEHTGELDLGKHIRRTCANQSCVAIQHLRACEPGAPQFAAGRKKQLQNALRGEDCPSAKITQADVDKIRELFQIGMTFKEIAKRFPVGPEAVSHICAGYVWGKPGARRRRNKLNKKTKGERCSHCRKAGHRRNHCPERQ